MGRNIGGQLWIVASLSIAGLGLAVRAHAFSDPARYSETTDTGGSAGRHFTGSPLDGYGCNACHQGGPAIPVSVSGLPTDGYQPGATYEVIIRLDSLNPSVEPHAALVLEFADEQRRPAGVIAPPEIPADATQFPIDELCVEDGVATGFALKQITNDSGRNLIAVPECGARAVRFFWTAPATSVGTVWMAGGVVHSDEQASPAGDGVTLLRRPLPSVVGQAYARELASGCSVRGATRPPSSPWTASVASLLVLGIARALRRPGPVTSNVESEERA
jgi:hypothetical protein